MPKRSPVEQLDQAIEMILAAPHQPMVQLSARDTEGLAKIAEILRDMPRPDFKEALKLSLLETKPMKETLLIAKPATPSFVRPGVNNIVPYIVVDGAEEFIGFLESAFAGVERICVPRADGSIMHAEMGIGNSAIELAEASQEHPPRPCTIHLYVESADATYARAVRAGAVSVYAVADQPWGDRQGCVRDRFGNVWYIAMPNGWEPGPEGLRSVQPFLHLHNATTMIPFLQDAFGAEVLGIAKSEEGKLLHSTVKIGIATLEVNEAHGEAQPRPCYLHVYVPDADALYAQALKAGGIAVEPPSDKPYGERSAAVRDPFGNTWYVATYLG